MDNIYNFLKGVFQELKQENSRHPLFVFILLSLFCIPLIYAANSVSLGVLAGVTLLTFRKKNFVWDRYLLLPVLLYLLMALSIFWTIDFAATSLALSKELPLVIIPICFMFFQPLTHEQKQKIIRFYSYGMVLYCAFYILRAIVRFAVYGDISVFFYHDLVTQDLNAIHVSVYISVAFFYFLAKPSKTIFEILSAVLLLVTVFLLSSKNIIAVFICLIVVFCLYYTKLSRKTRTISLIAFLMFISAFALMPKVQDRFRIEYESVMTDNTINESIGNPGALVYNMSVSQAWNNETFHPNDFFPGTAFRVYQFRIFCEMLREDNIFFTGYGLNASIPKIEQKAIEHKLFMGDGLQSGYQKKNFHDQYVQNFAELGIFGLLLLVAMLFVNLKNALSAKDFVHISFAILMISLFLTESFLWRQRGVTFFTMMYCLFNSGISEIGHKKNI